jgi:hypothetical protein
MNESQRWLEWLYGPEPSGLIWIGGHGDGFAGRTFTSISEAVAYANELDEGGRGGVYHRLTTLRDIERGRGTAGDSAYLPGFAMDLDLKGPGHKALNYPDTEQQLHELLAKAGLPDPTAWVHSGGGRYPFWKLEQPADLTIPGQLERAAALSSELHKHVMAWAAELGWKVDNTSDLARIYRLPGTLNRKSDTPARCTVQHSDGAAIAFDQIEYCVRSAAAPSYTAHEGQVSGGAEPVSQLFGGPSVTAHGMHRAFTLEQALEFVQPALASLRNARDGEINNRLLAAALTLAHFGPEFWDRDAAERQLYAALENTVYDGATWKAGDTIARAYRDMASRNGEQFWSATLARPTLDAPQPTGGRLRRALLRRSAIENLPDPVPLIEGVIYRNSVVVLSGKFGTYKSFVAVSMACALASGRAWFGHEVPTAVPVIYAAAEGAYGIKRRLLAWEKAHGPVPDSLYLIPVSVRLNRAEDMRELEEIIVETGAQVLIFDTLHASTPGVDENDAGQMGHVMDVLRGLQERHGMCSILPHHTGHAGERARGSSSVEDDADTTFVVRLRGEDRGPENVRTLVHRKTKDGPLLPDVDLKLVLVDGTGSGYVEPDAFAAAEVAPDRPEAWELGHGRCQVEIIKALRDQGGSVGSTKAECRQHVVERFYGGESKLLARSTFASAWTKVLEKRSSNGDPVVSNVGGQRYAVDEDALTMMPHPE